MVHQHQHAAIDAVRRTVTRATKPALAPLRAAAATLHSQPDTATGDVVAASPAAAGTREPDELDAMRDELAAMRDELAAMRDQPAAASGLRVDEPSERAERATRSASAYLEARRARLKRELRELREQH